MTGTPGDDGNTLEGAEGDASGHEVDGADVSDDVEVVEILPRLEEDDDVRRVVLGDRPVVAVVVRSGSVALEIRSLEGSVETMLRGPFRLVRGGETWDLDATRPAGLAPMLPLVGRGVERIDASPGGTLVVVLVGGERIDVRGGFGGPRWTLQGSGDLEVAPDFLAGPSGPPGGG